MKMVFHVSPENDGKVNETLKEDPFSRQSITSKNCESLGFDKKGKFILMEGDEEVLKKAEEELGDSIEKVGEEERKRVIEKIKESEDQALEGFGNIIG